MFDSPIVFCKVSKAWVSLAQTHDQCAATHRCQASADCPLVHCFAVREANAAPQPNLQRVSLALQGVRNISDESGVRSALSLIQGVTEVRVTQDLQSATVLFDSAKAASAQFVRALGAVGFRGRILPETKQTDGQ